MNSSKLIWETFNQTAKVMKAFPGLNLMESIGDFIFSSVSIYGYSGSYKQGNDNESNSITVNWKIYQMILYYVYESTDMGGNTVKKELYINLSNVSDYPDLLCCSFDEYLRTINSLYSCSIRENKIETGGHSYNLAYRSDKGSIMGILYRQQIRNSLYCTLITTNDTWRYSYDEGSTIEFIERSGMNEFISRLYGSI